MKNFFIASIFFLGCSLPICNIKPNIEEIPFFTKSNQWIEYIERVEVLTKESLVSYHESINLLAEIVSTTLQRKNIDEKFSDLCILLEKQTLKDYILSQDNEKKVSDLWQNISSTKQKLLYTSVVIADIRMTWQDAAKNCTLSKEDQQTQYKISQLPTISHIEKQIGKLNTLYDICHQLSLFNVNIHFPDI